MATTTAAFKSWFSGLWHHIVVW